MAGASSQLAGPEQVNHYSAISSAPFGNCNAEVRVVVIRVQHHCALLIGTEDNTASARLCAPFGSLAQELGDVCGFGTAGVTGQITPPGQLIPGGKMA